MKKGIDSEVCDIEKMKKFTSVRVKEDIKYKSNIIDENIWSMLGKVNYARKNIWHDDT